MEHVIIEADPRIPPVPWPMGVTLYVPSSIADELLRCLNELAGDGHRCGVGGKEEGGAR